MSRPGDSDVSKPGCKLLDEKTLLIPLSWDDFNPIVSPTYTSPGIHLDFNRSVEEFFWNSLQSYRDVNVHLDNAPPGFYRLYVHDYDRYLPWVSGWISFSDELVKYINDQLYFWKNGNPDIKVNLILTSVKGGPLITTKEGHQYLEKYDFAGIEGPGWQEGKHWTDNDPQTYGLEVQVITKSNGKYDSPLKPKPGNLSNEVIKGNKSEMPFGHIDGTKEGQVFANREELGLSGIHTPPQAGIWGRQNEGSASIVLSGGYADDIDDGDYILYTGQGGQDKPGGNQVRDQEFTLGNRALQLNKEYNLPLRVTRGYQVEKGPDEGYRYDGLYYVTEYERVEGKEGFQICRFHLQREVGSSSIEDIEHSISPAERVEYTGNRVKRNVSFAEQIKDLYDNTCQVCKVFLKTPIEGVGISEAAHIKAIGKPHNGDDTKANMLCLCPNHHAQFDRYTFYIEPETLEIVGLEEYKGKFISLNKKHKVNVDYFEYQKQQYLQNN